MQNVTIAILIIGVELVLLVLAGTAYYFWRPENIRPRPQDDTTQDLKLLEPLARQLIRLHEALLEDANRLDRGCSSRDDVPSAELHDSKSALIRSIERLRAAAAQLAAARPSMNCFAERLMEAQEEIHHAFEAYSRLAANNPPPAKPAAPVTADRPSAAPAPPEPAEEELQAGINAMAESVPSAASKKEKLQAEINALVEAVIPTAPKTEEERQKMEAEIEAQMQADLEAMLQSQEVPKKLPQAPPPVEPDMREKALSDFDQAMSSLASAVQGDELDHVPETGPDKNTAGPVSAPGTPAANDDAALQAEIDALLAMAEEITNPGSEPEPSQPVPATATLSASSGPAPGLDLLQSEIDMLLNMAGSQDQSEPAPSRFYAVAAQDDSGEPDPPFNPSAPPVHKSDADLQAEIDALLSGANRS